MFLGAVSGGGFNVDVREGVERVAFSNVGRYIVDGELYDSSGNDLELSVIEPRYVVL